MKGFWSWYFCVVGTLILLLRRSCDRSLRSLEQESPPKKKKLQPNTSTTHLLAGKKVPSSLQTKSSDQETTVFYIPGVDVKVSRLQPLGILLLSCSSSCLCIGQWQKFTSFWLMSFGGLNWLGFSSRSSYTTTLKHSKRSHPTPREDLPCPAPFPKNPSCMVWKIAALPMLPKARLTLSYLPHPHLYHQVLRSHHTCMPFDLS